MYLYTLPSILTARSRPNSRASMSSLNTIEDVNMAFQLTIAAGEQAMLDDELEMEGTGWLPALRKQIVWENTFLLVFGVGRIEGKTV